LRLKAGPLDRTGIAILVMLASTFVMAFQDAVVKHISVELPLWQIFVVRSLIVLPGLLGLLVLRRNWRRHVPMALGWATLRSLFLVFMYVAFYAALPLLDLSVVAAAYYTGPLFITLFAAVLLGEVLGVRRIAAVLAGFVGVLVILRPGSDQFSPLMLIPILAAALYAGAAILTRSKCCEESPLALSIVLNVAFVAVGGAFSVLMAVLNGWPDWIPDYPFLFGQWAPMRGREWGIVLILAAANLTIHLGLAKAYQSGPPSIIATFDYSYLPFAVFWGLIFFAEWPDLPTVSGMLLIAGAGLAVAFQRRR